jgi:hypothetical protein
MVSECSDPGSPEFKTIRGDLARLYLAHKSDLGLNGQSDDYVVANVFAITATLIQLSARALPSAIVSTTLLEDLVDDFFATDLAGDPQLDLAKIPADKYLARRREQ